MADTISVMDIDDDGDNNHAPKPSKGKNVVVSPPESTAIPWVEKYRPQSLDDVAAHRDIVETSKWLFYHYLRMCVYFISLLLCFEQLVRLLVLFS